jgi:hypothetical protein
VRHHHERWDGTGYPAGIKGTDIPLGARILSVVDCYDAITSDRPPIGDDARAGRAIPDRREGTLYDPWVVDGFISILDDLECSTPRKSRIGRAAGVGGTPPAPAGDRGDQNRGPRVRQAQARAARGVIGPGRGGTLFESLEPVVPVITLVLYVPVADSTDLVASGCAGLAVPAIANMRVAIGDRVSGWVFANRTAMVNSEAALELGPAARTSPVPLSYALVVPIISGGRCVGVVGLFGNERFTEDHQRFVESATALLPSVFSAATAS